MNKIWLSITALALVTSQAAIAQPGGHEGRGHGGEQGRGGDQGRHAGWGQDRGNGHQWRRGQQMGYNDWNSYHRVDYRQNHLRRPPRGYEWRRNGDQFVLGAIATGVIASIILNSGR